MENIHTKTQLKVSIPAILCLKSCLLLNGHYDIEIKDILLQASFNLDKPSKLLLRGNNKLVYIYNGIKFNVVFDFCKLLNSNDKKLRVTFEGENAEQLQCIFVKDLKTSKTKLIKVGELINRWIYFKNDKLENRLKVVNGDTEEYDDSFCLQERISSGLVSPYLVKLRVYDNDSYSKYMEFKFIKHGNNNFYDINSRNYLKLQDYLINLKFPVSVEKVYNEICKIYSIDPQNINDDYEIYLALSDTKDTHYAAYIEDINGQGKIIENGKSTEYKSKGNRLILNKNK